MRNRKEHVTSDQFVRKNRKLIKRIAKYPCDFQGTRYDTIIVRDSNHFFNILLVTYVHPFGALSVYYSHANRRPATTTENIRKSLSSTPPKEKKIENVSNSFHADDHRRKYTVSVCFSISKNRPDVYFVTLKLLEKLFR